MGAESVDPRISELRKLRERRGMVPGRTLVCQTIIDELNTTPAELHKRIVARLNDSANDPYAAALKAAYGLDPRYKGNTVTERREVFGGAQSPPIVPETVETWENRAIDELLARLQSPDQNLRTQWQLFVNAKVVGNRIVQVDVFDNDTSEQLLTVKSWPIPALIFQTPPRTAHYDLFLKATFLSDRDVAARKFWFGSGDDLPQLFNSTRPVDEGLIEHPVGGREVTAWFQGIKPGRFYALGWELL